jgi:hypothetical protein
LFWFWFAPFETLEPTPDPGVFIIFQDGELIQYKVYGRTDNYEVTFYLGVWFCQPCPGFTFRGVCSHVIRAKKVHGR